MRRRLRELGWGAAGFFAAFLIFASVAALWGIHINRIGKVVIQRPSHRPHPVLPHGAPRGGDALQPANAGQQPSPATVPATEHVGGSHHHSRHHTQPPLPTSSPSPVPSPSPPSTPQPESPPPAAPGNSGETPAAEHSEGVKACVNLVVSACAEAGAPKLLP